MRLKGTTLIEILFTFMISMVLITIIYMMITNVSHLKMTVSDYTDIEIAAKQLSVEFMSASQMDVEKDHISYIKNGQEFMIHLENNRLIKEPGYVVILMDLDEIEFDSDDLIYMRVIRNEKEYKEVIGIYSLTY